MAARGAGRALVGLPAPPEADIHAKSAIQPKLASPTSFGDQPIQILRANKAVFINKSRTEKPYRSN